MKLSQEELERAFSAIVDEKHGGVTVDGESFVVLHRETMADMQKEMEAILGRGAEGILMRAGYLRGRAFVLRLSSLVSGQEAAFVDGVRVFASRTGMFQLKDVKPEDARVTIRITNSFTGRTYGKAARPVCHYLRGFFVAMSEQLLHARDLVCREVRCEAVGDPDCTFEVIPIFGGAPGGPPQGAAVR